MNNKSRTEHSILNASVASLVRILTIVLGYVSRMVFTRMLDAHYVGISGLFQAVFMLLSFSELGISIAITYALYKPIAEGDTETQKSLMDLYRRFYNGVALFILLIGLLIFPFLDVLIKDQPNVDHLQLIYLLYLANSVMSYLFVHKKVLIDAHQQMYVSMCYYGLFMTLQYVLQIAILICTSNFILYLVVYLLCTFLHNIVISRKAEKMFPFIKETDVHPLSKEKSQEITKNIKAMFMHKIGTVAVQNTDSLLISSIIGIISTACYANYRLIIGSVQQVLTQAFQGLSASIGNLGAVEADHRKLATVFNSIFFIDFWLYGFASICLFELLTPFIAISFGAQYVLPVDVTFILCLNFYLTGIRQTVLSFRDSLGLFWHDRYKSIAEAVLNLVASVLLAFRFGISGIFWGTLISTVLVPLWVEPYILYKHEMHQSLLRYFVKLGVYTGAVFLCGIITHVICSHVEGDDIRQLLLKIPLCLTVPNCLIWLFFHRTAEYRHLLKKVRLFLRK